MVKHLAILGWFAVMMLAACASPTPSAPKPAAAPAAPVATEAPKPATATPALPDNIPIMPGAAELSFSESDISFFVKSDLNKVVEFYSKEMPAKGWKEQEKPAVIGILGRMNFATATQQASFNLIHSEALGQVQVRITIIGLNVAVPTTKP